MDNLEALTDSELRHRLIQYGFDNIPITSTTRKTLVKKLRNHVNNEKLKLRKETNQVTQYSSDEDSDYYKKRSSNIINSLSKSSRSYNNNNNNNNNNYSNSMPPPKSAPILPRRTTSNFLNRYTTSSNTYQPQQYQQQQQQPQYHYQTKLQQQEQQQQHHHQYSSRNSQSPTSRIFISPVLSGSSESDEEQDYYSNSHHNTQSTSLIPDRTQKFRTTEYNINDLAAAENNSHNGSIAGSENSYTSNFTTRLIRYRDQILKETAAATKKEIPSSYVRHSLSNKFRQQRDSISPGVAFSQFLQKIDEQYGLKQSVVPFLLIGSLCVFFSILVFMYITIQPDLETALTEKSIIYEICNSGVARSGNELSTNFCIEQSEIGPAIALIKRISPILQTLAKDNRCGDSTKSYLLSSKDIINMQQQEPNTSLRSAMKNLHNIEYLIDRNPHWNLNNVNQIGTKLSLTDVLKLRKTNDNYFGVLNPKIPLSCIIYNKLQVFFLFIGVTGLIALSILILYIFWKLLLTWRKSKQNKLTSFIDEIINHLQRKSTYEPENPTIVLNHLRDKLIPINKRTKSMEATWLEAIRYLEENESRIQFDVSVINGENCKILKWIDTVITPPPSVKKWQSPAFDKTANKIANPPTPCLKIRQMFDKFEANDVNLKQNIQNAILEKVGPQCRIYDIQFDKQSCCVYVRCASEKDAGIVHNEINGWWFDKRLVSIKFLRLERYLSRFPDSTSNVCLMPSNTKNLSMPTFGEIEDEEEI